MLYAYVLMHTIIDKSDPGGFCVPDWLRKNPEQSLELVVIPGEHRRHRVNLFREQTQIELGVALLDHAAQCRRAVDASQGLVHSVAIATYFADMARNALALSDEFFAKPEVCVLEETGLGMGSGSPEHRADEQSRKCG